jgi:hypothetical protein
MYGKIYMKKLLLLMIPKIKIQNKHTSANKLEPTAEEKTGGCDFLATGSD